ncbi:MAG: hypothetical protein WCW62_12560 [Bacteroidales bacterium]|jgi:hypothetical protein
MGSTGTGHFTDYSDNQRPRNNEDPSEPHETGGRSGNDKCQRAFSTNLEEVASSQYLIQNGYLPPVGTNVFISFNERIVAETEDGVCIGFLPTRFNYLLNCIENGFSYSGVIARSNSIPLPSLTIDVNPG